MAVSWIMFDKDGTLIQFDQSWVKIGIQLIDDVCEHFQIKQLEEVYEQLGVVKRQFKPGSIMASGTLEEMIEVFNSFAEQDTSQWVKQKSQSLIRQRIPENVLYKGVKTTLKLLQQQGYHLGIVTSDNSTGISYFMEQTQLQSLFDCVITTEENGYEKPDKRILTPLWERGVKPSEVVIVGDTDNDMLTGKNAQLLASIGVRTGLGQDALYKDADIIMSSVNELPEVLTRL
ncbi:HAD family hydrolase [Staphylococcus canis]|uniref:HAD family hydrolase n=1 Tax=Staphylococcus canis TaxID=2724942 RepID=A0ABS0T8K9_9STAP|nr:HAD family hydrolase [Staphylococcus canis]MBI5975077.1 HAD family hydrolase [Staphylococcus canis]